MNKEEMAQFQERMREEIGESYTVKVDKILSQSERNELIEYVKYHLGNPNISVLIIEPIPKPNFNFDYQILPTKDKETSVSNIEKKETVKNSQIYNEKWVVLQNRLLNAICPLDLNERRLIIYLSPLVRKAIDINPSQRTFVVKVVDFVNEFNIKSKAYYSELEDISLNLQKKYYEFWSFQENRKYDSKVRVTWISKGDYKKNQGEIHIDLHDDVIEMLTVFDKSNPFTKYEKQLITSLGSYGIVLFELISSVMHQQYKKKSYTIEFLREKFNCVESYDKVSDFKRYVLDRAIKDIESHTPYRIKYEQKKTGRELTHIIFNFDDISTREQNKNISIDKATKAVGIKKGQKSWKSKGLSDAQIKKLAIYKDQFVEANTHLLRDKNISYYDAFEDFKDQLKDPEQVGKFHLLAEFLALKKGDEPPKAAKKPAQSKKKSSKDTTKVSKRQGLTAEQIDFFANHPQFQIDHPVKGYEVGSKDHISYLKFRMDSAPGEFYKTDFDKYLK